ncbi:MAG TPA: hypothetical protein VFU76_06210 [Terriglobales bacterium]|nr:hypothetical protein [Terriglobales bacterium]
MAAGASEFRRKLGVSILAGFIVGGAATLVDFTVITFNRETLVHQMAGNVIAALVSTLFLLAVQLHNEELHYRFAMERAAIVSELNHHVRNAIFPLCLAVQRTGDAEALRMSSDAVERINIAMKDAATDVFALKIDYEDESRRTAA